jgi:hypothetical protein
MVDVGSGAGGERRDAGNAGLDRVQGDIIVDLGPGSGSRMTRLRNGGRGGRRRFGGCRVWAVGV